MNLYIQIENGQPINHPAFEENLIQAFGSVPSDWEPFVRVPRPTPTFYQVRVSDDPTYEKINGVWMDLWVLRDMTDAEKAAALAQYIQGIKDEIAWMISDSQTRISKLTDQTQIDVLNQFITLLNAVSFEDPTNIVMPDSPLMKKGVYTAHLDTNNVWKMNTIKIPT